MTKNEALVLIGNETVNHAYLEDQDIKDFERAQSAIILDNYDTLSFLYGQTYSSSLFEILDQYLTSEQKSKRINNDLKLTLDFTGNYTNEEIENGFAYQDDRKYNDETLSFGTVHHSINNDHSTTELLKDWLKHLNVDLSNSYIDDEYIDFDYVVSSNQYPVCYDKELKNTNKKFAITARLTIENAIGDNFTKEQLESIFI